MAGGAGRSNSRICAWSLQQIIKVGGNKRRIGCDLAGAVDEAEQVGPSAVLGGLGRRYPSGRQLFPWRQPVADVAGEFRGAQEGDVCTVREGGVGEGSPGHLRMVHGELRCVPDQRRTDAVPRTMSVADAQRIRDAAWEESVRADENAWRRPAR
jgi:hypothetical protein